MPRGFTVLGLALVASSIVCSQLPASDRVGADGLVTKIGLYRLYRGNLTFEIYRNKGKLNYRTGGTISVRHGLFKRERIEAFSGPAESFIDETRPWFAWIEKPSARAPHAIWLFNGDDRLVLESFDPEGSKDDYWGGIVTDTDSHPEIVATAPREVRDRLPAAFVEKCRRNSAVQPSRVNANPDARSPGTGGPRSAERK